MPVWDAQPQPLGLVPLALRGIEERVKEQEKTQALVQETRETYVAWRHSLDTTSRQPTWVASWASIQKPLEGSSWAAVFYGIVRRRSAR